MRHTVLRYGAAALCVLGAVYFLLPLSIGVLHIGMLYPAAGLLQYYRGHRLVLINKSPTPQDGRADLLLRGSIGPILTEAIRPLGGEAAL